MTTDEMERRLVEREFATMRPLVAEDVQMKLRTSQIPGRKEIQVTVGCSRCTESRRFRREVTAQASATMLKYVRHLNQAWLAGGDQQPAVGLSQSQRQCRCWMTAERASLNRIRSSEVDSARE